MSTEFQREERYVVFKLSDVADYFYPSEISQLFRLSSTQQVMRERNGKPPLECVVVEKDWPEYEPTWKAIEARVTGAQPTPSVPVDILYRLGAAHDACLDGDHRACRDAITQLMCEIGPDGAVPEAKP